MLTKLYQWLSPPLSSPKLICEQTKSIMYKQVSADICPHCANTGTIVYIDLNNAKVICESCTMQYWLYKETARELGKR